MSASWHYARAEQHSENIALPEQKCLLSVLLSFKTGGSAVFERRLGDWDQPKILN